MLAWLPIGLSAPVLFRVFFWPPETYLPTCAWHTRRTGKITPPPHTKSSPGPITDGSWRRISQAPQRQVEYLWAIKIQLHTELFCLPLKPFMGWLQVPLFVPHSLTHISWDHFLNELQIFVSRPDSGRTQTKTKHDLRVACFFQEGRKHRTSLAGILVGQWAVVTSRYQTLVRLLWVFSTRSCPWACP